MSRFKQWAVAAAFGVAFASPSAMANLVSDPGFELGGGSWAMTGWGITSDRGISSGSNAISTACADPDLTICTFSQTLATTPGTRYDITFFLYTDGLFGAATSPNGLRISFDGFEVDTISNFPSTNPDSLLLDPGGLPTQFTYSNVLATTSSAELQFGGFHEQSFIFVDDVSVTAVPEPASLALLGLGLVGLGFSRCRKTRTGNLDPRQEI